MSDAAQYAVLLILVPLAVWYGARIFAEGFREGWRESMQEREERRQARGRHPSSGTMPWAPDDARDLDPDA